MHMNIKIVFNIILLGFAAAHTGFVSAQSPADGGHNSGARTSILPIEKNHGVLYVRDFCAHGMQFMAVVQKKETTNNGSGGVSVVQVNGVDGKPMRCGAVPASPN